MHKCINDCCKQLFFILDLKNDYLYLYRQVYSKYIKLFIRAIKNRLKIHRKFFDKGRHQE